MFSTRLPTVILKPIHRLQFYNTKAEVRCCTAHQVTLPDTSLCRHQHCHIYRHCTRCDNLACQHRKVFNEEPLCPAVLLRYHHNVIQLFNSLAISLLLSRLRQGNTYLTLLTLWVIYRVAQNKIPHQTIPNISATSGLILKILEAA